MEPVASVEGFIQAGDFAGLAAYCEDAEVLVST